MEHNQLVNHQNTQNLKTQEYNQELQKKSINDLAFSLHPHYKKFDVANRLLFTGHSHQAWPDVAFDGFTQYQKVVSEHLDEKWPIVFNKIKQLTNFLKKLYNDPNGHYCRENNTHTLLVSWLSSLDLKNKPRLITTDGQFHSMYRQLQLYDQNDVAEVILTPVEPIQSFVDRIISSINEKTSAVLSSRIFFQSGKIFPIEDLKRLAQKCRQNNVFLILDDYHGTGVVPLDITKEGLDDIFIVSGGYKYLQWGEGNCFLRYPANYKNYPTISGWKASFGGLVKQRVQGLIQFDEGQNRFISGNFDAVSMYRAGKVLDFFTEQNLTIEVLRKQYVGQCKYLRRKFKALNLDQNHIKLKDDLEAQKFGGFVSFISSKTGQISKTVRSKGVRNDYRGSIMRLGFGPYITTFQIDQCIQKLEIAVKQVFAKQQN